MTRPKLSKSDLLKQSRGGNAERVLDVCRHSQIDLLIKQTIVTRDDCWSGTPCIKDSRIRVSDVVDVVCLGLKEEEEFLKDYNYITQEMMDACLFFADKDRTKYLPIKPDKRFIFLDQ